MSTLLEQAIVDATALKEAALKSAENSILEKYAPEVKSLAMRWAMKGKHLMPCLWQRLKKPHCARVPTTMRR